MQFQCGRRFIGKLTARQAMSRGIVPLKWVLKDIPETAMYLRTRHQALIDLTYQYGVPSSMLTIAPTVYNNSFPAGFFISNRDRLARWRWSFGRRTSYATCAGSCGSRLVTCRRATNKNTFSVVRQSYEAYNTSSLGRTGRVSGWCSCSPCLLRTRLSRHGRGAQTYSVVVGRPTKHRFSTLYSCRPSSRTRIVAFSSY